MAEPPEHITYTDEEMGLGTMLLEKTKRNPFLVLGVTGCLATVAVGAFRFKNRSKDFPMSLFFIQLRVAAQSVVIGSLTIGMAWGMFKDYVLKDNQNPKIQ